MPEAGSRRHRRGRAVALVIGAGLAVLLAALSVPHGSDLPPSRPTTFVPSGPTDWTVYHHDSQGSGVDTSGTNLNSAAPAWTSAPVDGQLYGEPLEEGGRVFVATENDTVYALAADTGAVMWSTHLGTPVPTGVLPCGNIGPTVGITSTPVIDAARGEIFVVADEMVGTSVSHRLFGLSLFNGSVLLSQGVDPSGAYPPALLQRTALTVDNGLVVFGFGGNYGDCSSYHGWVVGVPEGGGFLTTFEVDGGPGQSQGAVWMGGAAPVVDAQGNVWVASGNGSVTSPGPYDDSDAVLELSPGLQLEQSFAPSTWFSDNAADRDLGSSSPVLIGNGTVLQAGKSQTAYLLSQASLGGIGGQLTEQSSFCGNDVDGGSAVFGGVAYVPCQNGIMAVQTSAAPPAISVLWRTPTGSSGPPIVAGSLIWTISGNGTLYGLSPATGGAVEQFALGSVANHFPTPAVGDGLLLAASTNRVHAFAGPAGLPGPPSPPPTSGPAYWMVASDGGVFSFGDAGFHGSMGGTSLVAPIVAVTNAP